MARAATLDTPWKLTLELRRLVVAPYVRAYFALHGIPWRPGWKLYGCPIIQKHRQSRITIGSDLSIRSWKSSNPLGPYRPAILSTRNAGAELRLGDGVGMTGGTICAAQSIQIGNRVFIGANATIIDTDFHPIDPAVRRERPWDGASEPIVIEDDAFIGMNAIVLRGVHIGQGAFIGAGSVVAANVPPYVICAGNPARIIRELHPARKDT